MADQTRDQDAGKRAAAAAAVALVQDGMTLGLGTGSTMVFVVDLLADRIAREGLRVRGVPTSERTDAQARARGVPLTTLDAAAALDLAIDGADEVERGTLNLIKGLGGALLREKMVVQAARRFVVVADRSKLVDRIGALSPLPIEVVAFAHAATARRIAALGVTPALRMADGAPVRTDNGNLILDARITAAVTDLPALDDALRQIAGVVETGLFLGCAALAIIGDADGGTTAMERGTR